MVIAIRKEPEGYIYIDKTFLERFGEEQLEEYGYTLVEVDDKYFDCEGYDFNDDLTFNIDKYNERKQKELNKNYETLIVSKIRERYSLDQELAILRQRDTKPEEFAEYNEYVENCKLESKEKLKLTKENNL